MRRELWKARDDQDLSAADVAGMVGRWLRDHGDLDATDPNPNTIYAWEKGNRNPSIANFEAWAAVLGYQLHVRLDDGDSGRVPILVKNEEAAEAARRIDLLPEARRKSVLDVLRGLTGG